MLSRRIVALGCTGALALGLVVTSGSVQAAPARATVGVKASTTKAVTGTRVKFTGKVRGRAGRATVVLQRKKGLRWVKVRSAKVSTSRRYVLRTTVREGATKYRVKVLGSRAVGASTSRTVKVRGIRPAVPRPTPTPTVTPTATPTTATPTTATPTTATPTATPTPTVTPTPTPTPTATPAPGVAEVQRILEETNAFRAENGKAALELDTAMSKVAADWSRHMGETNTFEHNPDYASQIPAGWTSAAENIAAGYTVDAVVTGWINSAGHRRNLLGDFTHIGIGYASVQGASYTRYYTQNFAKYPSR